MADKDKKGGIGLLIGIGPKKPMSDDDDDAKDLAAQGVLDAIDSKDAAALREALDAFYSAE